MIKRGAVIFLLIGMLGILSACHVPMPNTSNYTMSNLTLQNFSILGLGTSDFQWYFDDVLQEEQSSTFYYLPLWPGQHVIRVSFMDKSIPTQYIWNVTVKGYTFTAEE